MRSSSRSPLHPLGSAHVASGVSDSPSGFLLKSLGRTPQGRGRVRLEVEVKPAGVPFDGAGLVTGLETDTGAPAGAGSAVSLSKLVSGLAPGTLYHWRLRTASDSPFFPRSPWLSLPYNAVTESDVRTAEGGSGVASSPEASVHLWLGPSAPNPFGTATQFAYTLPEAGHLRLAVYDVQGRQAALLADENRRAGHYTARWDGRDRRRSKLPSGVYFLLLEFGGRVETRKIVISP